MSEFGVSMNRAGTRLRVPVTRISEIVNQRRPVASDTALRLARYFGTTPEFWMNLQTSYDMDPPKKPLDTRFHCANFLAMMLKIQQEPRP